MQIVLSIGIIIVCVLLVLVVLVQNSKGGGISSNFSSANQVMGVRRSADFIEKATWTLAIVLLLLSLLSAPRTGGTTSGSDEKSITRTQLENGGVPASQPAAPQQQPAAGQQQPQTK